MQRETDRQTDATPRSSKLGVFTPRSSYPATPFISLITLSIRAWFETEEEEGKASGRAFGGSVAKSAKGAEEEKKGESRSENNVTFAYHVDPLCLAYPGMQINWGLFGNCEPRVEEREME